MVYTFKINHEIIWANWKIDIERKWSIAGVQFMHRKSAHKSMNIHYDY